MQALKAYVIGRGVLLIWDMMGYFGFNYNDTVSVLNIFANIMYSVAGDAVTVPLSLIIWIYDTASGAVAALPNWVSELYNYVMGNLTNDLAWAVGRIQDINAAMDSVTSGIDNTINYWIGQAFSGWQDVLNFADWVRYNAGDWFYQFMQDPAGFIGSIALNYVRSNFPALGELIAFYLNVLSNARQVLIHFLNDPASFVLDLLRPAIQAVIAPFIPLLSFLAWWTDKGQPFMLALIDDPVKVILDLIADEFLHWLSGLIADNW